MLARHLCQSIVCAVHDDWAARMKTMLFIQVSRPYCSSPHMESQLLDAIEAM
jgi:hypothetical protein